MYTNTSTHIMHTEWCVWLKLSKPRTRLFQGDSDKLNVQYLINTASRRGDNMCHCCFVNKFQCRHQGSMVHKVKTAHIHTCTHVRKHTHTHTCIYTHTCKCAHTCKSRLTFQFTDIKLLASTSYSQIIWKEPYATFKVTPAIIHQVNKTVKSVLPSKGYLSGMIWLLTGIYCTGEHLVSANHYAQICVI